MGGAPCDEGAHATDADTADHAMAEQRGCGMDYGKSGAPKTGKAAPRHKEHNAKGTAQNPFGRQAPKAELLERMKAAAAKKTAG